MNIGDHVRVLDPFAAAFPGVYAIEAMDGETATICGDRQFAVTHIALTEDALEGYTPPQAEAATDLTISAAQARAVLLQQGLLDQVTALVDDPATPQIIKIFWEYEHTLNRSSPALNQMATALGLTSSQLDALFAAAKQIVV
mgnify:CR=1 FL=1